MCGAADVFSATPMSPHVVASFSVYFADVSIVIAGSFFQLSFFAEPAAGLAQGSGALLVGVALGVTSALALVFLSSSFFSTPVVYRATLPITTTPSTDAITELRTRDLRRASVRRCCCRKNFSRAS